MQQDYKLEKPASASVFSEWVQQNFRYFPPALITLILIVGQLTYGILDSYVNLAVSIGTAVITEVILAYYVLGIRKNIASAYITGISVGILIRSTAVWPYAATAMISIMSKYVFRYKGRHLWNPSNFGVSWMLLLNSMTVAGLSMQWGSNFAAMGIIWALGLLIVSRAKRLHVPVTYLICYVVLSFVSSLIIGDTFLAELAPITGPKYQLFIFFMLTDPPTSVSTRKGRIIVVILVAIVEFVLRYFSVIYAPFYALCMVGPIARFIDLKRQSNREASPLAVSQK